MSGLPRCELQAPRVVCLNPQHETESRVAADGCSARRAQQLLMQQGVLRQLQQVVKHCQGAAHAVIARKAPPARSRCTCARPVPAGSSGQAGRYASRMRAGCGRDVRRGRQAASSPEPSAPRRCCGRCRRCPWGRTTCTPSSQRTAASQGPCRTCAAWTSPWTCAAPCCSCHPILCPMFWVQGPHGSMQSHSSQRPGAACMCRLVKQLGGQRSSSEHAEVSHADASRACAAEKGGL